MSLDIEIRGLDELVRDLGVLGVLRVLRAPMIRSMAAVVNRMADYPPQRPSLYRRTGTLGRRWTQTQPAMNENTTELVVKVGNNTSYGPWVQSKQFQAEIHQGYWQTDMEVLEDLRPQIEAALNAAVQTALDEAGE